MHPTPGGNADNSETKGLAGKAICNTMKTKGGQKRKNPGQECCGEVAQRTSTPVVLQKNLELLESKGS